MCKKCKCDVDHNGLANETGNTMVIPNKLDGIFRWKVRLTDAEINTRKYDYPIFQLPKYSTKLSSGMDIRSIDGGVIKGNGGTAIFRTGWGMEIANDLELQLRPRSGLAFKHNITIINTPATIDADFISPTDEIKIKLINHGKEDYVVEPGEKIAQAIVSPVLRIPKYIQDVTRNGGFGSTGKK